MDQSSDRKLGNLKIRRQQQLEGFIIDFYCEEIRLGIEVDGEIHFTQEQWEYDIQRTGYLAEFGIRIIRFTNEEVNSNIKEVLSKISNEAYIKFTPASCLGHPSPWGECQE